MATEFICMESPKFHLHFLLDLNQRCKELLFINRFQNLEENALNLAPVLVPMGDNYAIQDAKHPIRTWGAYKSSVRFSLEKRRVILGQLSDNRQSCPLPDVKGFMVDERRLCGPDDLGRSSGN
jgi:hypothetical protein